MKFIILGLLLVSASACGRESTPTPSATQIAETASLPSGYSRVDDTSQVCMVTNQYMGRTQIPVTVEDRTYYGCCPMCKDRLNKEPATRTASDPVTGETVDKASAVIVKARWTTSLLRKRAHAQPVSRIAMLGDYVVHFPLTDFAVSLLAMAALLEMVRLVFKRDVLSFPVDLLLYTGGLGALAAVASGWWLIAVTGHGHDALLSLHHVFAYGTLAAAIVAVAARLLRDRWAGFAAVKTGALLLSALLVSGAGFYGGKMAHSRNDSSAHREMPAAPASHDH